MANLLAGKFFVEEFEVSGKRLFPVFVLLVFCTSLVGYKYEIKDK
jgi:hypothetical protein